MGILLNGLGSQVITAYDPKSFQPSGRYTGSTGAIGSTGAAISVDLRDPHTKEAQYHADDRQYKEEV
jgi:hypothetical protein